MSRSDVFDESDDEADDIKDDDDDDMKDDDIDDVDSENNSDDEKEEVENDDEYDLEDIKDFKTVLQKVRIISQVVIVTQKRILSFQSYCQVAKLKLLHSIRD